MIVDNKEKIDSKNFQICYKSDLKKWKVRSRIEVASVTFHDVLYFNSIQECADYIKAFLVPNKKFKYTI